MGKHSNSQLCTDANKTLKILVLGDNNVGKSALVVRFLTRRFIGEYASGKDMKYEKVISYAGRKILTEIVDSSVLENHETVVSDLSRSMKTCDACLIVHDICNIKSFEFSQNIATKIRFGQVELNKSNQIPILMVGNKSDLQHLRRISVEEASKAAEHIGLCHYVETSAAESFEAVDSVFRQLFRLVKASSQALETATLEFESNEPKERRRRRSLTQMKQKILEHCRKVQSSTDLKPLSQANINKDSSTKFNHTHNNVKEKRMKNRKIRISSSKSSMFAEKCRSLGTLREQPEDDQAQSRSTNDQRFKTLPNNIYDKTSFCNDKRLWFKRKRSKTSASLTSEESFFESCVDEANSIEGLLSPTLDEVFKKTTLSSLNRFPVTPELLGNENVDESLKGLKDEVFHKDQNETDISVGPKPSLSKCKSSTKSASDAESQVGSKSGCCNKKNKICTKNGIIRIFKSAINYEKEKEDDRKATFYIYDENEEKNNNSLHSCENYFDLRNSSSKCKQTKQKQRKKISLRDAVNEIIRMRKKSTNSMSIKNVGVI